MTYIQLSSLCSINMGQSPDSSTYNKEGIGIPFFQGNADFGETFPNVRVWCSNPTKTAKPHDILISVRAPIGSMNYARETCCIGRGLAAITPNSDKVYPEYIYWLLRSKNAELNNLGTGSTFKAIGRKTLESIQVPCIRKEKQQYIADCFWNINQVIRHRKQQLDDMDNLIKARFVEMFGDPIMNTQNRPVVDFIDIVMMQRGFDLPVQDRHQEGGVLVFGSNGPLDRHNTPKVCGGGVITGRSGTIGKVFYTEKDYWPLNTTLFSVDTHGNNVVYLAYLLQLYDLARFTEGTGVPTLNRNKFHKKPLIAVPLREQEQFATFVKQVDKSKVVGLEACAEIRCLK